MRVCIYVTPGYCRRKELIENILCSYIYCNLSYSYKRGLTYKILYERTQ